MASDCNESIRTQKRIIDIQSIFDDQIVHKYAHTIMSAKENENFMLLNINREYGKIILNHLFSGKSTKYKIKILLTFLIKYKQ